MIPLSANLVCERLAICCLCVVSAAAAAASCFCPFLPLCFSEFGDVVATSESLEVEDAVAFDDSVAAIRRHLEDGTSNENVFEVVYSTAAIVF